MIAVLRSFVRVYNVEMDRSYLETYIFGIGFQFRRCSKIFKSLPKFPGLIFTFLHLIHEVLNLVTQCYILFIPFSNLSFLKTFEAEIPLVN